MAQAWLHRRFDGLTLGSFDDGIFIFCCCAELQPPPPFRDAWCSYDARTSQALPEVFPNCQSILIFANPCQQGQMDSLRHLIACLNEVDDIPPVLWVPHTAAPEARSAEERDCMSAGPVWLEVMEAGLDDIIHCEPEGVSLVVAVRTRIQRSVALAQMLNNIVAERRAAAQNMATLEGAIHDTLWCHLLVRCAPAVPPVDHSLPSGELRAVPGYSIGDMLGQGSFCKVHRMIPVGPADEAPGGQHVAKIVNKSRLSDAERIKRLSHMVNVLVLLNQWTHPNITRLTAIYHSQTHICFCETYGGPQNLYNWLLRSLRPLAVEQVTSLVVQLCRAVAHLHVGPQVCHLDIKPENIIINEAKAPIALTLSDFDLAVVQKSTAKCSRPCGTLPFIAPEVLAARTYDGMASDIWSEAMVLFEVHCGVRVIEKMLGVDSGQMLGASKLDANGRRRIAGLIRGCFEDPGAVGAHLESRCFGELAELLPTLKPMLTGMLALDPMRRFTAQQVLDAIVDLTDAQPPAH